MSNKPQKPLTKKKSTTVRWTKNSDDRLLTLEKQISDIEKKMETLIKTYSPKQKSNNPSRVVYSIRKKT